MALSPPGYESTAGLPMSPGAPPWQGRSIASSKLRMLEFSAFLEQPQDPETVSRHCNPQTLAIYITVSQIKSCMTSDQNTMIYTV